MSCSQAEYAGGTLDQTKILGRRIALARRSQIIQLGILDGTGYRRVVMLDGSVFHNEDGVL